MSWGSCACYKPKHRNIFIYIEKEFKAVRYCAILSFHRLVSVTIFATINVIYSQGIHYIENHNGGGGGGEPYESSTTSTSAYCILTLFS